MTEGFTMRSSAIALLTLLCVSSLTVYPNAVRASDITVSGTVTYAVTQSGRTALPADRYVVQNHLKGVILVDKTSSPLNLSAQDCNGEAVNDAKGAPIEDAGTCLAVDKDGDVWWLWYRDKGNTRTWSIISGTGKYDGMKGGGTTKILLFAADRATISWSGTLTMK